jgi:hypothetical protein
MSSSNPCHHNGVSCVHAQLEGIRALFLTAPEGVAVVQNDESRRVTVTFVTDVDDASGQ